MKETVTDTIENGDKWPLGVKTIDIKCQGYKDKTEKQCFAPGHFMYRRVKTQDSRQVTRCTLCQAAHRRVVISKSARNRRAKQKQQD